jgi:hypothetical protein
MCFSLFFFFFFQFDRRNEQKLAQTTRNAEARAIGAADTFRTGVVENSTVDSCDEKTMVVDESAETDETVSVSKTESVDDETPAVVAVVAATSEEVVT